LDFDRSHHTVPKVYEQYLLQCFCGSCLLLSYSAAHGG
jgi:hypothetical protein